jgi:DNA-directed RNA polymerase subunit RPC12/RpoP
MGRMPKVQIWGYRCERCRHEWVPRDKDQDPKVCPHCKSPYWDRPRQGVQKQKDENRAKSKAKQR